MAELTVLQGPAAALRIDNLDTDQIMPKQFLRGIDKAGLAQGLLYDLRFDAQGRARPDFVLNQPAHADSSILIAGANFGCGSSREHAVWGLQQYGIRAVLAPSFGEIFYSNAMNNGLLALMLPVDAITALMAWAEGAPDGGPAAEVSIALNDSVVRAGGLEVPFDMSARHRRMVMEGLDVIGLSMTYQPQIEAFAAAHAARSPWLVDVAARVRARIGEGPATPSWG
ncbi:3-isopropylmalate/(R)-2-methylmalate dehydratase small subunit [Roseateles sp. YR242]|uniref:3-isopropylmalate dehydratase small subunit n=1 Tax=Roseateles sp. YR242 TaxID=1855305 RepID=UPI0008C08B18|nr:3-isopropylmalate dehydratase small subunit [Roseateles sp. YR242]SEK87866.1 3-isopropylmalate/(R)-2-methylmalate dehydratase small subunit [Roseateles sp. YR242]